MIWLGLEERETTTESERARERERKRDKDFCCIAAENSNTGSFRVLSHKKSISGNPQLTARYKNLCIKRSGTDSYIPCM